MAPTTAILLSQRKNITNGELVAVEALRRTRVALRYSKQSSKGTTHNQSLALHVTLHRAGLAIRISSLISPDFPSSNVKRGSRDMTTIVFSQTSPLPSAEGPHLDSPLRPSVLSFTAQTKTNPSRSVAPAASGTPSGPFRQSRSP